MNCWCFAILLSVQYFSTHKTHIHTKLTAAIPYFSHSRQCCLPIISLRMRQRMNIAEQVERSERQHGHERRRRQWSTRSYIRANKKWSLVDEKLAHIKCLLAFSKYLYLLPSLTHPLALLLSLVSYSRPLRSSSRVNIPPFSHHSLRSFSYLKLYLSSSTRLFFLTPNEAFSTLHAWIREDEHCDESKPRDMSGGKTRNLCEIWGFRYNSSSFISHPSSNHILHFCFNHRAKTSS